MTAEIQLITKEEVYGLEDQGIPVVSCGMGNRIETHNMSSIAKSPAIGRCRIWGDILLARGGECMFDGCKENSRPVRIIK